MIWKTGPVPRTGLYWIRTRGTIEPWIQKIYFNERHFEELYEWQPVVLPEMVEQFEESLNDTIAMTIGDYKDGFSDALKAFSEIIKGGGK